MGEPSVWTLPWGQEVLQRLQAAHKSTREAFERAGKTHDLHPGTEIANYWPFITGCYSGFEQSLKVILASERGLTVEQLLKKKGRKYVTHDLGRLFSNIGDSAKQVLDEYYERFQSLHNYIESSNLKQFLSEVSGASGSGYERWRYSLVETDGEMPRMCVECMLSMWGATVDLIASRQYPDTNRHVVMPDDELRDAMQASFHDASDGDIEAVNEFVDPHKNALSAVAALLWKDHRGICTEADGLDWLATFLRRTLSAITEESNRSNVSMFINRARGKSSSGLSVSWNCQRQRFEDVPWNLPKRVIDALPCGTQEFIPERYDDLLRQVYQEGFSVRENLGGVPTDPKWSCTLVAEKKEESEGVLILKVWAQKFAPYLHIELEGSDTWKTTSIQEWVNRSLWQNASLSR